MKEINSLKKKISEFKESLEFTEEMLEKKAEKMTGDINATCRKRVSKRLRSIRWILITSTGS